MRMVNLTRQEVLHIVSGKHHPFVKGSIIYAFCFVALCILICTFFSQLLIPTMISDMRTFFAFCGVLHFALQALVRIMHMYE